MNIPLLLIFLSCVTSTPPNADNRIITTLKDSKNYVRPTVINGIPASDGQIPYVVSIKQRLVKVSQLKYIWTNICGGSIISKIKVLTAAHCFEAQNFYFLKHPDQLSIVAGNFTTELIHSGQTDTSPRSQWRKIKKVYLHNNFNFPDHDIALVIVNEPWKFNVNVGIIRMARKRTDYGGDCVAAGFGSITFRDDDTSQVLLVGHMFLMPRRNCTNMYEMNMDKFICSYSFMSDVGRGDSGGPLACRETLDPTEQKGKPLLVGVVCGKNFDKTSLYTRVSEYRRWVEGNYKNGCGVQRISIVLVCLVIINHVFCL